MSVIFIYYLFLLNVPLERSKYWCLDAAVQTFLSDLLINNKAFALSFCEFEEFDVCRRFSHSDTSTDASSFIITALQTNLALHTLINHKLSVFRQAFYGRKYII